ncbi:hypothetical protein SUGI_0000770 [Cryptomeria japonica]|uniref:uncharacterized protein LOC131036689 n=1 Tax=Cryptomeria japonica TaxID=3369 RepID=UPI002408C7C2|nr:uncharacterized protein LOC131036689 [Cryptomeria japonica]GLJ04658.1 hypothetical protein SUGI_0000770 [Cryptomeria japonica]
MALEWGILGVAAGVELLLLLVITLPGAQSLRKTLISFSRASLRPLLTVVPFSCFLLMDIYWKYDHLPTCEGSECTSYELDRHYKSVLKMQRNLLLVGGALVLYWLLYRVTFMLVCMEQLHLQVKKFKDADIKEADK